MKTVISKLFLIIFLILIINFCFGQKKNTIFNPKIDTILIYNAFIENRNTEFNPKISFQLDSIVQFLKNDTLIYAEIRCFYYEEVSNYSSIASIKAQSICNYIVENGINPRRVFPMAYYNISQKNISESDTKMLKCVMILLKDFPN